MRIISNKIENIWKQNKSDFETKLASWAETLKCGKQISSRAKKQFHQWLPLRTYISVTNSKYKSKAVYSLRFYGQEVANLVVEDKDVNMKLNKTHEKNNANYFKIKSTAGNCEWAGKEAKEFRAAFKDLAKKTKGPPKVRIPEHRVESKFIAEMCEKSGKFGVAGLQIQPVVIENRFPLQIPLPISANTGIPVPGKGNIDILARRRASDHKIRLSVWELKKPEAYAHAAAQAYIYAYTLLLVLRESKSKDEWFKLFGFRRNIPKRMTIEAVVAITSDQRSKFIRERDTLGYTGPVIRGNDRIELYDAYYKEKSDSIKLEKNPFGARL